jgi:hypothetical protein
LKSPSQAVAPSASFRHFSQSSHCTHCKSAAAGLVLQAAPLQVAPLLVAPLEAAPLQVAPQ